MQDPDIKYRSRRRDLLIAAPTQHSSAGNSVADMQPLSRARDTAIPCSTQYAPGRSESAQILMLEEHPKKAVSQATITTPQHAGVRGLMGKLHQIEYALTAVQKGETCLGIKAVNGIVLATEKKLSSILVDEASVYKASQIASHMGASYAGITADFRVLIQKARKYAVKYSLSYGELIPTSQLSFELSNVVQEFTQSGGVRPFGVSMLIGGYDEYGPQLYQIDPSGAYFSWKATAIGKNMNNAKLFLEKRFVEGQEIEDAVHTALMTLKDGFEGEMNEHNVDIAVIGRDRLFKVLTPNEIKDYLGEVQ